MSVCAVVLCKDEADLIAHTIRHLATQVDEILVADNLSTDGTPEILAGLREELGDQLTVRIDQEVAYNQADKTTRLARLALERGHAWVLPCDADEYWRSPDLRPIRDYLAGLAPDTMIVRAPLYNHLPTALDDESLQSPFARIGWRKREPQPIKFGKVLARCRPDLRIGMGNHEAWTDGTGIEQVGLEIRHYSWRSALQYLRKIRNGAAAYAASSLPETYGAHWRMFESASDSDIIRHFQQWFWSGDPEGDDSLIYDPIMLPTGQPL